MFRPTVQVLWNVQAYITIIMQCSGLHTVQVLCNVQTYSKNTMLSPTVVQV